MRRQEYFTDKLWELLSSDLTRGLSMLEKIALMEKMKIKLLSIEIRKDKE